MKRVAILGATGMLGSMMYGELARFGHPVTIVVRNPKRVKVLTDTFGTFPKTRVVVWDFETVTSLPEMMRLSKAIGDVDVVVNCAGMIPQHGISSVGAISVVNAMLPHLLSLVYGKKLIHASTDCVFDGKKGKYTERSIPCPDSLYGTTKLLGEPWERSLVIRTSLFGPELGIGSASLFAWFFAQKGKIPGYVNHHWNGVTTKEFARITSEIITHRNRYPTTGLYHLYSTDMTKFEMLNAYTRVFHRSVTIVPTKTPLVDRRLRTIHPFCKMLSIQPFEKMLADIVLSSPS